MSWLKAPIVLAVVLFLAAAAYFNLALAADYEAVHRIDRDVRLADVLDRLKAHGRRGTIVFANVSIIDPVEARVIAAQSVVVRGSQIVWVGPSKSMPVVPGATMIEGNGKYLSPGLTDMHVHTQGVGEHILRLAAGVTGVREMVGFPWLLKLRNAIAQDRMIGATMYVAGTIIADQPLDGYAVVVATPKEARHVVRAQRACGYSFIKVHNSLALPLFDAVADETRRAGLDLVGHVPHNISLVHAIQSGRMRTLEHLKGFLIDQTLLPSAEDYRPALAGAEVWISPTLYGQIDYAYGEDAKRRLDDPRMRFVTHANREKWAKGLPAAGSEKVLLGETFKSTQAKVMARLLSLHPRWLAGTDAAGYAFNIAGFALLDELQLLHAAGVSVAEVIRAATSEAAAAMRQKDFGRIEPGTRADLVLLDGNPFESLDAYRAIVGVMARGAWMDRRALDEALSELATIYAERTPTSFSGTNAMRLARDAELRASRGHVFESFALMAAAHALRSVGHTGAALSLEKLTDITTSGACGAAWPN